MSGQPNLSDYLNMEYERSHSRACTPSDVGSIMFYWLARYPVVKRPKTYYQNPWLVFPTPDAPMTATLTVRILSIVEDLHESGLRPASAINGRSLQLRDRRFAHGLYGDTSQTLHIKRGLH